MAARTSTKTAPKTSSKTAPKSSTKTAPTAAPADKSVADRMAEMAKDVLFVSVGAGVLAFQRAQVQRVELTKALETRMADGRKQFSDMTKAATTTTEGQFAKLDDQLTSIETRVDDVLEQVQVRLPKPAGDVLGQARTAAKGARQQLRTLISA